MNSIVVALLTFGCCLAGAAFGMLLRGMLPKRHLCDGTKETIQLGMGLIAAMVALVLGLLVAAAMASFDQHRQNLNELATNIVQLDRALAHYGPAAAQPRLRLREAVADAIERIWPTGGVPHPELTSERMTSEAEALYSSIRALAPSNDMERALQSESLSTIGELNKTRWNLTQHVDTTIPPVFLALLIVWLTILFVSFGLFSPVNPTVMVTLLLCAASVAGAMLMIIDLDQPSTGIVQISNAPLVHALDQLGR
ncbi:MAG TPA: DUF4239 domain-containing protein [Pirellulales bacterium]|nr:DUF4239 domain-containing protein [Pirellulales bacterium]